MSKIAVVDDDVCIGDMIERVLKKEGHTVLRAYSGTEALLLLEKNRPELIILDLMLPGLSGEEVLSHIQGIPVIVLSAKIDVQDKVRTLLGGAADYMTKPFDVSELLARITVQLRSGRAEAEGRVLTYGALTLDDGLHEVKAGDRMIRLTRTEYAILRLLMQNPKQVIPKSVLLDRVSEVTPDCVESSLKVHISNLRRKLREADDRDYIEAVWGIGFKLRDFSDLN
ncbi:MAG: response regulator transcription factor [Lachnospiraceae bacterium]|nr:response regulator transcription factor [Lachnospiraceae bacterium]